MSISIIESTPKRDHRELLLVLSHLLQRRYTQDFYFQQMTLFFSMLLPAITWLYTICYALIYDQSSSVEP
ncbi:MAG: hypothetical protein AAGI25_04050 [Bacteroidota bacterium]